MCLVLSGLGPTLPRLQHLHQLDIWLIQKWDELLIARFTSVTTMDIFPISTLLPVCLESVWSFLVFDVVILTEYDYPVFPLYAVGVGHDKPGQFSFFFFFELIVVSG